MDVENEYKDAMKHLYERSLMMENPSEFHPVLRFYFMDALAHLDYSIGVLAYNIMSVKNELSREHLRWRVDEAEKEDRPLFRAFINWLEDNHSEKHETLPMVWQLVYDRQNKVGYRAFRIVLDPDSTRPTPVRFFFDAIDEFFDPGFLKSIYAEGSLGRLFEEFKRPEREGGTS